MNEKKPVSRLRQLLDSVYGRKCFWIIPIALAVATYVLYLIFGEGEEKAFLLIASPIMSFIAFAGVYGIVSFQIRNPQCSEGFLNGGLLMFTVVFGFSAVGLLITFLSNVQHGYAFSLPMVLSVLSAISLAYGKRKD